MSYITSIRALKHEVFSAKDLFSEDKPYITTNESNTETVLSFLSENRGDDSNRLHIGFSGWYNFDIIRASEAQYAIVADVSERTAALFKATKKTINHSRDRFEFIEQMVKIFEDNHFYRTREHAEQNQSDKLRNELTNRFSWLGDDQGFEKIKEMYSSGRIIFAALDIRNAEVFKKLSLWIEANDLHLHTLYVSNIGDIFMDKCVAQADTSSDLFQMEASLKHIACGNHSETTWVIDATRIDHEYDDHFDTNQNILDLKTYTPFFFRQARIKKAQDIVARMLLEGTEDAWP